MRTILVMKFLENDMNIRWIVMAEIIVSLMTIFPYQVKEEVML